MGAGQACRLAGLRRPGQGRQGGRAALWPPHVAAAGAATTTAMYAGSDGVPSPYQSICHRCCLGSFPFIFIRYGHKLGVRQRLSRLGGSLNSLGLRNDLKRFYVDIAPSDLQLPFRQWGAGNVYLLVLYKAKM